MTLPKTREVPPQTIEPQPAAPGPMPRPSRWWLVGLVAAVVLAYWAFHRASPREAGDSAARAPARAVPVAVEPARQGDMPVTLTGLGTVTAFNTVTVRTRVEGQLVKVAFQEGQFVREGELLVEIDPRPFEAQLVQAEGQLARDQAQLQDAKINLERYRELLAKQYISQQQYDTQGASVGQFAGAVKADSGAIASAKLQLAYSKITAPISGRVGLRLVDVGNVVHPTDANGLVVITQVQPIAVLFTIPEDDLPGVLAKLQARQPLPVEAYDRSGRTKIADGELVTVDNQIDPTTGTSRLKAVFQNGDHALFPNQFVNVRLRLDVRRGVVIAPTVAIQRGPQGPFVFVVKPDQTVDARPVTVGITAGADSSLDGGLSAGESVVVDGADKLRPGAKVELQAAAAATTPRQKHKP
jgi:membrane fusion protein, multidrug efflux system